VRRESGLSMTKIKMFAHNIWLTERKTPHTKEKSQQKCTTHLKVQRTGKGTNGQKNEK
jgi:hypothetical protein